MSESGVSRSLRTSLDVHVDAGRAQRGLVSRERELEAKVATLQKDYAELHTAIFEAAQVHRRLCAPRLVRFGEFEIASEIFAVRHLPGDFFMVQDVAGDIVMGLGDVAGKGLAAGMWIPHLVGLLGTHANLDSDPRTIVSAVNRELCRLAPVAPLVSLFLARLDPVSGWLKYCSAGHPPALLLRADGKLESLSQGGLLLGVLASASYTQEVVQLNQGDVLLVYSDGIHEARNAADQEFGYDRLAAELLRAHRGTTESVLFSVLGAVQDFAAPQALADDTSLVVLGRRDTVL